MELRSDLSRSLSTSLTSSKVVTEPRLKLERRESSRPMIYYYSVGEGEA